MSETVELKVIYIFHSGPTCQSGLRVQAYFFLALSSSRCTECTRRFLHRARAPRSSPAARPAGGARRRPDEAPLAP
jgi:hypothetical protein